MTVKQELAAGLQDVIDSMELVQDHPLATPPAEEVVKLERMWPVKSAD